MAKFEKVAGRCPMGCGETLFLGNGGHVTCSLLGCPSPTAADELLHGDERQDARQRAIARVEARGAAPDGPARPERENAMPNVSGAKPVNGPPCHHDSTRLDGTLDCNCLRCGADGYWHDGHRHDRDHPSGKVLVVLACGTA